MVYQVPKWFSNNKKVMVDDLHACGGLLSPKTLIFFVYISSTSRLHFVYHSLIWYELNDPERQRDGLPGPQVVQ